jgi:putative SOS response-associated peptidase YedK
MCGRLTVNSQAQYIAEFFAALNCSDVPKSYNISPTQALPAVRIDPENGRRTLIDLHWGLIPFWAKDIKIANKLINARSETLSEKPSFRAAYKYRRCILPVDGFYEWKREGNAKQPFYFKSPKDEPLPFAGLWESWTSPEGSEILSCAIITTEANDLMQPVHHRMPAMVMPEHRDAWLDPKFYDKDALREVTRSPADDLLTCYPVSKFVNYSGNDGEKCIEPLPDKDSGKKADDAQRNLF